MIPARQSTALELAIGPVLDADGVAVTNGVVGDFKLKKTTGNFAALNGSATLTHVSAGFYDLVLTTSDTDTVGLCCIAIDDTTNCCPPVYLQVIEEAVYDRDYAASAVGYITDQPVNTTKVGGTSQTARDIGASVLLSSGTGTGQLDFTSGRVKADTVYWNASAVASPHTAGYPVVTNKVGTGTGENLLSGGVCTASLDANVIGAAQFTQNSGYRPTHYASTQAGSTSTTIVLSAGASSSDDAYNGQLIILTSSGASALITDYVGSTKTATITPAWVSTPGTGVAYCIRPTYAMDNPAVRVEIDANSTQLAAIKAKTDNLPASPASTTNITTVGAVSGAVGSVTGDVGGNVVGSVGSVTGLTASNLDTTVSSRLASASYTSPPSAASIATAVRTGSAMTEAYAADGAAPTLEQCLFMIQQKLCDFSISGTTLTVKKLDGSTTAATFTLDSSTAPTSITRAS